MATRLQVGTSGFSYEEWRPGFYPDDVAKDDMLAYYSSQLPAVELNNTFYRMPSKQVVARWASAVPDGFGFAVKASRRFTWSQKLRDCEDLIGYLFGVTAELGDKLGCVFYQLPKWLRKDVPLLEEFLAQQPAGARTAFEFTHDSWLDDEVTRALRARDAALVLSDKDDAEAAELVDTGSWAYLRLRRSEYTDDDLQAWHQRIAARDLERCFVFFKHEDNCAGPRLARRFLDMS